MRRSSPFDPTQFLQIREQFSGGGLADARHGKEQILITAADRGALHLAFDFGIDHVELLHQSGLEPSDPLLLCDCRNIFPADLWRR